MKFKINIPEPCQENWQEMTPSQKGKFCARCQKEVTDFTKLSSSEIARKMSKDKQLCGRFTKAQLEEKYVLSSSSGLNRLGLSLGLGSIIAVAQPSFAQEKRSIQKSVLSFQNEKSQQQKEEVNISKILKNKMPVGGLNDSIIITGIVTDEENLPLPGVYVLQQNSTNSTQTDFDGNFSITIPKQDFENEIFLEVSYLGFETKFIQINEAQELQNIKLEMHGELLGEIVVYRPNIFKRFFNLFRSSENKRY
ncbi:CarboxypepD_reg-like domain-containing protein [Mesonia phycicola]|uniref:CarboxypepD_reg-like domain-containing protein n=1 Tax=Mesonia phycicola TaxID=579105 RepID=A0A1M6GJP9_9FLAO|nr:carboxypeptidase-like regulatory domain-containing protein [Mesonia phycicola]SHJ10156.1 CarboxypepD_reg-like domain-containing protein [Mesonia phycicola]